MANTVIIKMFVKYLSFSAVIHLVMSMQSSKAIEGYAAGTMPLCPGFKDDIKILKRSLKDISIVTVARDNILTASLNKTFYNYHQMKQLGRVTDFKKKTLVYMVGYLDSPRLFTPGVFMGYLHFERGYNVWLLDFYNLSIRTYGLTLRVLRPLCERFADMLVELTKFGLNPKKLHLLGLSNGGQGVSLIAKHYQKLTGVKIARVTSLDPVGLCFRNVAPGSRVDKSDADFVDVIHTNIDGYGIPFPSGHVDFYVNGGEYQPSQLLSTFHCGSVCSHMAAYNYWVGSLVDPEGFIGIQCDSVQQARNKECYERQPRVTNVLGLDVNKSRQGIFYLATGPIFPFTMGKKGLLKDNQDYDERWNFFNGF